MSVDGIINSIVSNVESNVKSSTANIIDTAKNENTSVSIQAIESDVKKTVDNTVTNAMSSVNNNIAYTSQKIKDMLKNPEKILTQAISEKAITEQLEKEIKAKIAASNLNMDNTKTLVKSYVQQTYGSKDFMNDVNNKIGIEVSRNLEKLIDNRFEDISKDVVSNINDKLMENCNKINELQTNIFNITNKLDKVTDISKLIPNISSSIKNGMSFDDITEKINTNSVLKYIQPSITNILSASTLTITEKMLSNNTSSNIANLQEKLLTQQKMLENYNKKLQQEKAKLLAVVDSYKQTLKTEVQKYTDAIISDIKSKIKIDIKW